MSRVVQLHPDEASHRSASIAVDMAHSLARQLDTLSDFISKEEMLHLQMNLLFVMIDIMGATSNMDPDVVLDQCKLYFSRLKRSEFNNAPKG
jgi:hypothetical protein